MNTGEKQDGSRNRYKCINLWIHWGFGIPQWCKEVLNKIDIIIIPEIVINGFIYV